MKNYKFNCVFERVVDQLRRNPLIEAAYSLLKENPDNDLKYPQFFLKSLLIDFDGRVGIGNNRGQQF